tara:strand:+ start:7252 stop:7719 length:468 start_codon:yes stop_codon:yes gene_type:complete
MWIALHLSNYQVFDKELKKKFKDFEIYFPKIRVKEKNSSKNLLGNYIFCYSDLFKHDVITNYKLKYMKGVKKILKSSCSNEEIFNFVSFCKKYHDKDGFLANSFFKDKLISTGRIINGPFMNLIFDLVKKEKNKIRVLIGNMKLSISDKSNFIYS